MASRFRERTCDGAVVTARRIPVAVLTPDDVRPLSEDETREVDAWLLRINEALEQTRGVHVTAVLAHPLSTTPRVVKEVLAAVAAAGWCPRFVPTDSERDAQIVIAAAVST